MNNHYNGCWADEGHHTCAVNALRELYSTSMNLLAVLNGSSITMPAHQAQLLSIAVAEILSVINKVEYSEIKRIAPLHAVEV